MNQRPTPSAAELLHALDALEAAAAADAWDEALALEAHCRVLLEALLDLPGDVPMDLERAEALEHVATVYRRLVELASDCRSAVAAELKTLRHGRRAAHAYGVEGGA